ncbi:hypothetical protein [Streptomyces sp. LNU-CPARS28]|uniref:hypothetical protein n=1 Tax=Streptomyces sp. LNU-CPARS28 TaxID=3137371 RepID=UPI0031370302
MSDVRAQLGADIARRSAGAGASTLVCRVVDVTDTGGVNLLYRGALLLDVECSTAYRGRQAGDLVHVRPGVRPLVLWKVGEDPGAPDESSVRDIAREIAVDEDAVTAATWGTGGPPGSGWQTVTTTYVRKDADGKAQLYFQLGSVTDPSPADPGRAPKAKTISPTASGTWRGGRPDDYASSPTQGDWTGRGNRRGGWFYGAAIQNACSGRTVSKMTVSFARKRGSGINGKIPMNLFLHDYQNPPSGQLNLGSGPEDGLLRLSVGARGTATLPASWRSQLASGAARGLAIYASGRSEYGSFTGGKITISFSA